MPKPKKTDKKKVSRKPMAKPRGGSSRNLSGMFQFLDWSGSSSGGGMYVTWIIAGQTTGDYFLWLYQSIQGADFVRGTDSINNLAEGTDQITDSFGLPTPTDGQVCQLYATVTDSRGELLAKSPIAAVTFED